MLLVHKEKFPPYWPWVDQVVTWSSGAEVGCLLEYSYRQLRDELLPSHFPKPHGCLSIGRYCCSSQVVRYAGYRRAVALFSSTEGSRHWSLEIDNCASVFQAYPSKWEIVIKLATNYLASSRASPRTLSRAIIIVGLPGLPWSRVLTSSLQCVSYVHRPLSFHLALTFSEQSWKVKWGCKAARMVPVVLYTVLLVFAPDSSRVCECTFLADPHNLEQIVRYSSDQVQHTFRTLVCYSQVRFVHVNRPHRHYYLAWANIGVSCSRHFVLVRISTTTVVHIVVVLVVFTEVPHLEVCCFLTR